MKIQPLKINRFRKTLLFRQALETGALMGTGDMVAQTLIERKKLERNYDPSRTLMFLLLGSFFVGPMLSAWYKCLYKLGHRDKDKSQTVILLQKVLLDQLVFAPSSLVVVLSILSLMQGGNLKSAKEEIKEKYVDILVKNWQVWPAIQMFNFYLVPLKYQVLLVQSLGLLWNTYLSWKIHN
ncbi:unnamed protein product [Acanthoscelides obtectus]|uniref:Mitochondrial inner membrane protein Mpv17 n=1 Tax=Acanthoscelides obtectus TaxID=200917 RepID=A0A9P0KZ45_ACAOB|nr:unnamed protein product [Acanthoscelides obtectus]CAK1646304.1 Protein Mpv17 [Acanthoscelides obtectus]